MHILDNLVTEVLYNVFGKMKSASKDVIVGSTYQKTKISVRNELQKAKADNAKANKEYESLKAEVIKYLLEQTEKCSV